MNELVCKKCGGLCKEGTALANTIVASEDFGNDANSRGATSSYSGPAKLYKVDKCCRCGSNECVNVYEYLLSRVDRLEDLIKNVLLILNNNDNV